MRLEQICAEPNLNALFILCSGFKVQTVPCASPGSGARRTALLRA